MASIEDEIVQEVNYNNHSARQVKTVLRFLNEDLSVPFIARYRKNETGCMTAEVIREIKETYSKIKAVRLKAESIIKKIGDEASRDLIKSISHAKSIEEIQELYAPFKKGGKGTLAERARTLGLDVPVDQILAEPSQHINFNRYTQPNCEGLHSDNDVRSGIMHIIADRIAKDTTTKEIVNKHIGNRNIKMIAKQCTKGKELDIKQKYANYYKFEIAFDRLHSHQVLAINRGEQQKILSVKLEVKSHTRQYVINNIKSAWIPQYSSGSYRKLLEDSVEDSFKRLVEKSLLRHSRGRLTKKAEKEAVEVFTSNLKHLYLVSPLKSTPVLSLDPGFKNGCKVALIDKNGLLLETSVIYPFSQKSRALDMLKSLINKYQIEIIALGNGTACRETEKFLTELFAASKNSNLKYCIVNESGASVYSVTKEAKDEFDDLDPNLISAVSIGRRLQDPLSELIKIEAKHIGVGMYQHDIAMTLLNTAVEAVVEDCVSFVGVDLNTCSTNLLSRVAGISTKQAQSIVHYRSKQGGFVNREQLKEVKGVGEVTFRNCAGFVRINNGPQQKESCHTAQDQPVQVGSSLKRKMSGKSASSKRAKTDFKFEALDRTWIHPELYQLTYKLMDVLGVTSPSIGSNDMIDKINENTNLTGLCDKLKSNEETISLILEGLKQPCDFDPRLNFETPMFKRGLTSMEQLKVGDVVSGAVRNRTSFGVFVDIGIESDALIPQRFLQPGNELGPGDRVECRVKSVELQRRRVALELVRKISLELKLE